jgi:hypothetical protein|eukprot:COSAG06_NODE_5101_length_3717_cov_2.100332_2_plen_41_part_00
MQGALWAALATLSGVARQGGAIQFNYTGAPQNYTVARGVK